MKKYLLLMVMIAGQCFAQAPEIQWEQQYGGSKSESNPKIISAHGGGYLVALWTVSFDGDISFFNGGHDFWLVRVDALGNLQWEKTYGGDGFDFQPSVVAAPDGGYIIAGTTRPSSGDDQSSQNLVIKIDGEGAVEWTRCFGGPLDDYAKDIKITPDGGCVIAGVIDTGDAEPFSLLGWDASVTKLGPDGETQWQQTYGGSSTDYAEKIIVLANGYALGCSTASNDGDVIGNHGSSDFWILQLDEAGNIASQQCYGGESADNFKDFCMATDGGYLLMGAGYTGSGYPTLLMVKTDDSGDVAWEGEYSGDDNIEREGYSVTTDNDGGFLLAGSVDLEADAPPQERTWREAFVLKLDTTGEVIWETTIGGPRTDSAQSILPIPDGYIMAGTYQNGLEHHEEQSDLWIVKLGTEALSVPTFLQDSMSVSPNPASSILNIHMPIGVKIEKTVIYDSTGKTIAVQNGAMRSLNIESIAAGIYFVEVYTDTGKKAIKFLKD